MKNKDILKAGASKVKITPPLDVCLVGFGKRRGSKENDLKPRYVHDDLYVKTLVLEQGSETIALVVCDLISLDGFLVNNVRRIVNEKIGIPPHNILLAATHTHSGPGLREGIMSDSIFYGDINHRWKDRLAESIAQAIINAFENKCPAEVGFTSGEVQGVAHTRRLKLSTGQIFNPSGYLEKKPAGAKVINQGPVDNELGVMYLRNNQRKPLAVILNYANHPWISPEMFISAEISGEACQLIEEKINQEVIVMLFNSAGGDSSVAATLRQPIPKSDKERLKWWNEEQERFGQMIADESLRVIGQISNFDPNAEIKSIYRQLAIGMKTPLEDLPADDKNRRSIEILKKLPQQKLFKDNKIITEVQVFKVGDAVIAGLPGEILAKLGMNIKKNSGYKKTYVFAYCGDYISYIPPKDYYPEGGYEVTAALVEPGAGEFLCDAVLDLIRKFQ